MKKMLIVVVSVFFVSSCSQEGDIVNNTYYVVTDDLIEMVEVPAATDFDMGYTGVADAVPVHTVPFISSFKIGIFEGIFTRILSFRVLQFEVPESNKVNKLMAEVHGNRTGEDSVTV